MTKKQALIVAKLRQIEIQSKRRPLQEGGPVDSQWGGMTSESRLINMGHYAKSSGRARIDYLREAIRKAKQDRPTKIVVIKH